MASTRPICHAITLILAVGSTPVLDLTDWAASAQEPTGCRALVDRAALLVTGDETDNDIEFVGTAEGVQLTCDGTSTTFEGIGEIVVAGGEGNDQISIDNFNGLLVAVARFRIAGQGGDDFWKHTYVNEFAAGIFAEFASFDGGPGTDQIELIAGSSADRILIEPRMDFGSVEVHVIDVATETPLAAVLGSAVEGLSVKAGRGDDQFHVSGLLAVTLGLFGQDGNEGIDVLVGNTGGDRLFDWTWDGGKGHDKLTVAGASDSERYEITPAPDRAVPDPHVQVTDQTTGEVTAALFVQQTEEVRIEAGGGDDHLDVQWDIEQMSGLIALQADLGDGDDAMTVNVLSVLAAPAAREVRMAVFDVAAGAGDDQLTFIDAAGNWLDVSFIARLGAGHDKVDAWIAPSDRSLPGPSGARQVAIEVSAGNDDDVVNVRHDGGGVLFGVSLETDLGRGNDLLGAAGALALVARPGRGFDTAQVTRNLLRFVAEFERVEVLDELFEPK